MGADFIQTGSPAGSITHSSQKRGYPYKKRVNIFSDLSCQELLFSPKKVPGPFLIIRKAILSLNIRGEHRGLVVE